MCQKCIDSVKRYFPNLPEDKYGGFLMDCTCFPFGDAEEVEKQVKELSEQTSSYEECQAIVERKLSEDMEKYRMEENLSKNKEKPEKIA